jgi:hypothetical protein
MNRLEIRTIVRKRLGETTGAFWTDPELNTWINVACKDVAFRTKCLRTNGLLTTTADTQEYALSGFTNILSVLEVEYYQDGTTWEKIIATTREELNSLTPGWKSADSGTPQKYYADREENVIGFYPKPDDDNDGAYCRVYYTYNHTDIAGDTDSPLFLADILHLAIIDWVVATGFETRGYIDKSNDVWSKYMSKLHDYQVERHREKEDEEIIMKSIYNL